MSDCTSKHQLCASTSFTRQQSPAVLNHKAHHATSCMLANKSCTQAMTNKDAHPCALLLAAKPLNPGSLPHLGVCKVAQPRVDVVDCKDRHVRAEAVFSNRVQEAAVSGNSDEVWVALESSDGKGEFQQR